jgi:hypothetical protein
MARNGSFESLLAKGMERGRRGMRRGELDESREEWGTRRSAELSGFAGDHQGASRIHTPWSGRRVIPGLGTTRGEGSRRRRQRLAIITTITSASTIAK